MKGRIFVVNHDFMEHLNDNLEIKANLPTLKSTKRWFGSLTSLIADMFQTEIGDYAFFWETKGNNPDSYIWGVYRIISNPFFDPSEPNCIKLKIEHAYSFSTPLTEYDILNDPYNKIDLWNIIGKKIKGVGRATTQLLPYETEFLIQKLIDKNIYDEKSFIPYTDKKIKLKNEIKINYSIFDNHPITNYSELDINHISYIKPNGTAQYEKFMELIFNILIRTKNSEILKKVGISSDHIFWYANYLPYSLDKSEIDYLVIESSDHTNIDKINVIEFQKYTLDEKHIHQAAFYSNWINYKLAKGSNISQPIIICEQFNTALEAKIREKEKYYHTKKIKIYTINFKDGIIDIKERR